MIVQYNSTRKFNIKPSKDVACIKKDHQFLKYRQNRSVRFSANNFFLLSETSVESKEIRSRIWYGASDINLIKYKIVIECCSFKNLQLQNKETFAASKIKVMCMRGLEQRFDEKRRMRRIIAIQAVLKNQNQFKFKSRLVREFYIVNISKRFSTTAKSQALLDGLADKRNVKLESGMKLVNNRHSS